jgi:hypothetical protein
VIQTAALPPNQGRRRFAMMGSIRKSKKAPRKMVRP